MLTQYYKALNVGVRGPSRMSFRVTRHGFTGHRKSPMTQVNTTMRVNYRIMCPNPRFFSGKAHQPLIKFVGKRTWPSGRHTHTCIYSGKKIHVAAREVPHAHPAAPSGLRPESVSSPSSESFTTHSRTVFNPYWEAPGRLWYPTIRNLHDTEMDAIMVGSRTTLI